MVEFGEKHKALVGIIEAIESKIYEIKSKQENEINQQ